MRNNRVSNINDSSHLTNSIAPIDKNLFVRTTNINLDSKNFDKYSNSNKNNSKPTKLYLRRNTKVHPANLDLKYTSKDSRYDNRYNNKNYNGNYNGNYNRNNKRFATTHDHSYNTDTSTNYENYKVAYDNIKRKKLDEYMEKFVKTPEYNKYIRNLSDSDSEKMNNALMKNYAYSLSRPLSYSNSICNTYQNSYQSNYNVSK